MGNARGNTHSRNHLTKSPTKPEFWDFSWHEIGIYDLPAMINYVIAWTGQPQIHYIGYSQGTTAFLVMTSLRTEFNDKIKCAQMMAPVAFMSNLSSPLIRAVAPFVNQLEWVLDKLNVHEYLPNANAKGKQNRSTLLNNSVFQDIVANALFMTGGFNTAQLDKRIIPQILQNTPAGASAKQVIHYGQGFNSGKFRQFDYGSVKNLDKYGSTSPPDYPIKDNIKCPIVLHYSENDWLSAVQDVEKLANELTSLKGILKVPDNKFNHYDYVWGRHANSLLYDKVIQLMEGY